MNGPFEAEELIDALELIDEDIEVRPHGEGIMFSPGCSKHEVIAVSRSGVQVMNGRGRFVEVFKDLKAFSPTSLAILLTGKVIHKGGSS